MCKKRKKLEDVLSIRILKLLCVFSYVLIALGLIFSCHMHLKYPSFNPFVLLLIIFASFAFSLFIAQKTQLKMEKDRKEVQKQELKELFKTHPLVRYKTSDKTVSETPLQLLLVDLQNMDCFECEAYFSNDTIYVAIHANNKCDLIPFQNYKVFFNNFEIIK